MKREIYELQFKEGRKWKTGGGFGCIGKKPSKAFLESMRKAFPKMNYRLVRVTKLKGE